MFCYREPLEPLFQLQTSLKPLVMNIHDNHNSKSLEDNLRPGHLNL